MSVSIVYKLKCNSRYIDVAGYLAGSNLPNSSINFSASNSRIIIDLKKKLVLYPNEKKVDSLVEYEYDNTIPADSCFSYNLPAVKTFNNITGCKKIFKNISPGIVIKNAPFGLQEVQTSGFFILLKNYAPVKWNPNFSKEFKKYKKLQMDMYEFLQE